MDCQRLAATFTPSDNDYCLDVQVKVNFTQQEIITAVARTIKFIIMTTLVTSIQYLPELFRMVS